MSPNKPLPKQFMPKDKSLFTSDDIKDNKEKELEYIKHITLISQMIDKHIKSFIDKKENFIAYKDETDSEYVSFTWQAEFGRTSLEVHIYSLKNNIVGKSIDVMKFLAKASITPIYYKELSKIINKLEIVKRNAKQ